MWTIIIALGIGIILSIFVFDEDYILTIIISGIAGTIVAFALPAKTEVITDTYKLNNNNNECYHIYKEDGLLSSDLKCAFYYEFNGSYRIMEQNINNISFKNILVGDPKVKMSWKKSVNANIAFINYFAIDIDYMYCVIYVPESFKGKNGWK
jgi:hypothetical protein